MPSKIEWTEATWNPIAGCSIVSPGCHNCYAMQMAKRLAAMGQAKYQGTVDAEGRWTGKINIDEAALLAPLKRKKPTVYFVNSMSDLFHESIPTEVIDTVFAVMALTPQHTYQVLTKRAWRMHDLMIGERMPLIETIAKRIARGLNDSSAVMTDRTLVGTWPWPHVWLGVSAEDQKRWDDRVPMLLKTPAAVRFVSAEPLLGAIEVELCPWPRGWTRPTDDISDGIHPLRWCGREGRGLDWVIVGGESGAKARPMHPDWVRSIRDQCQAAGVRFFFKQWGEYAPLQGDPGRCDTVRIDRHGADVSGLYGLHDEADAVLVKCGKKDAGRVLDGREWNEMPKVAPV